MKVFSLLLLVVLLNGCSKLKPLPQCAQQPDKSKLSSVETLALSHAIANFGQACNIGDIPCDISLFRNKQNDILVTVAFVHPDRETGECYQAPGAENVALYNSNGVFIRTIISL